MLDSSVIQRSRIRFLVKKAWSRSAYHRCGLPHPYQSISTNDPRPRWDVSVRLILDWFESGSFSDENKRRISKFPVAPHYSVRGYVKKKDNIKGGAASSAARQFWVHFVYLPRAGNTDSFIYPPTGARSEELH